VDDAGLAALHKVVVVVAQLGSAITDEERAELRADLERVGLLRRVPTPA
jgi:hypothetical protein